MDKSYTQHQDNWVKYLYPVAHFSDLLTDLWV